MIYYIKIDSIFSVKVSLFESMYGSGEFFRSATYNKFERQFNLAVDKLITQSFKTWKNSNKSTRTDRYVFTI